MAKPPVILFASENLQLGGLLLIALARMAAEGEIELAGAWTNCATEPGPGLDAAGHRLLREANSVAVPEAVLGQPGANPEAAIFGGVLVNDYATLAFELGVAHSHVPDMAARHVAAAVDGMGVDLGIVCGHGRRFPPAVLESARRGWVNLHPSLLPRHRGPFPGFWEMRGGEAESGVTAHVMESEFDSGPMVAQTPIGLPQPVTFRELVALQAEAAARMAGDLLRFALGDLEAVAQEGEGSHEPMPGPMDVVLDSGMTCAGVERFVAGMRGVTPVLVADGNKAYAVDGLVRVIEGRAGEGEGTVRWKSREVLTMEVGDGVVDLLVSPFVGEGGTEDDGGREGAGQ